MRIENDKVLNELFEEEFEKIPFLFRFSRKRAIAMFSIMCAFIVISLVFVVLYFSSGSTHMGETIPGMLYQKVINEYDDRIGVGLFFSCFGLIATIAIMAAAKWFEDRAFKKASRLAQMISISEHRIEMDRWEKTRSERDIW